MLYHGYHDLNDILLQRGMNLQLLPNHSCEVTLASNSHFGEDQICFHIADSPYRDKTDKSFKFVNVNQSRSAPLVLTEDRGSCLLPFTIPSGWRESVSLSRQLATARGD